MNFDTVDKELVVPGVSLMDKVVIYQVSCDECGWSVASYSKDLALYALAEHMKHDHRAEIITLIRELDNIDQVLLDLLTDPPRKFYEQVLRKQITLWAIDMKDWISAPDVIQVR